MRGHGYVKGAISAVIVQYNRQDLTEKLIKSLPEGLHEIVCVQNGNGEQPLGTHNVALSDNVGWGRGTNAGAALAEGEYLLLLNNDVECHEGFLEPLVARIARSTVGCVAGTLLNSDGTVQHAGIDLFFDQQGTLTAANRTVPSEPLDVVSLAAALVRAEAFWHVGGISPTFWCGYEDVDFCLKLRQGGWRVVYAPESVATHGPHGSGPDRWAHVHDNIRELHMRWADMLSSYDGETLGAEATTDR